MVANMTLEEKAWLKLALHSYELTWYSRLVLLPVSRPIMGVLAISHPCGDWTSQACASPMLGRVFELRTLSARFRLASQ